MKFIKSKKGLALLATLAVAAVAAFGAYAYFTSSGNGSGSGKVGSDTAWQVDTSAYTGGPLYPGAGSESIAYTVTNNNPGSQELNSVDISVANADGSPWTSGTCSAADFSVDGAAAGATATDTYGGPTNDLASGANAGGTITLTMVDTGANQNDCRSVTVPLYLSAS